MKSDLYKRQIIMFIVMVIIGMLFNPMNILAYLYKININININIYMINKLIIFGKYILDTEHLLFFEIFYFCF